ncbi:AraC family transcriptional regulator N-terminal domain-containing protein [Rhizobium sophorae]|uniref:AraC family transcriptional regulator N-terminal domain-containing protein n=1 Tax=Rhizobium sophorae TaxID=1535242 RepID=UPI0028ACC503|nr:AraC family transcriptional regulator N-terminal domain-containing protein [Rhizobium sophorae]
MGGRHHHLALNTGNEDLSAVGSVHPSAAGEPYLAVSLTLGPTIVAGLIRDLPVKVSSELFGSGFSVAPVNKDLLDAWIPMLRLMEQPEEIAVLPCLRAGNPVTRPPGTTRVDVTRHRLARHGALAYQHRDQLDSSEFCRDNQG